MKQEHSAKNVRNQLAETKQDPDTEKGATESDHYDGDTPVSMSGQLPHRTADPMLKDADSDFPEPGGGPEHTGEPQTADPKNEN
jgi:hypothetical protein